MPGCGRLLPTSALHLLQRGSSYLIIHNVHIVHTRLPSMCFMIETKAAEDCGMGCGPDGVSWRIFPSPLCPGDHVQMKAPGPRCGEVVVRVEVGSWTSSPNGCHLPSVFHFDGFLAAQTLWEGKAVDE